MSKILQQRLALVLITAAVVGGGFVLAAQPAAAAINVTGVSLNGVPLANGNVLTVRPNTVVTVTVNVNVTTGSSWGSTAWRLANTGGDYACVNTPDHASNGPATETFTLTAPAGVGPYNFYLYSSPSANGCSGGGSTFNYAKALTVDNTKVTLNGVLLKGGNSITVKGGDPIHVTVEVTDPHNFWGSTAWRLSPAAPAPIGSYNCLNTPDQPADQADKIIAFDIVAPANDGTYKVDFLLSASTNGCSYGGSTNFVYSNGVIVDNENISAESLSQTPQYPLPMIMTFNQDLFNPLTLGIGGIFQGLNDCGDNDAKTYCFNYYGD